MVRARAGVTRWKVIDEAQRDYTALSFTSKREYWEACICDVIFFFCNPWSSNLVAHFPYLLCNVRYTENIIAWVNGQPCIQRMLIDINGIHVKLHKCCFKLHSERLLNFLAPWVPSLIMGRSVTQNSRRGQLCEAF